MKKFKKVLSGLLVFAILFACVPAMASGDKVEISFCIGDETLTINGNPVTVEKPYAVGAGVTLVPVRVITEAFGAKVDWIGETQTIKISYPDVEIVLQIGNPVAEVNGKAEQLLAPPEVPGYGVTMVPLRFISETFGAEVSYDSATQKITVVKEKISDETSLVEGAVNSTYIGDSYYGWHMENPKDMYMDYRSFDGAYTSFTYDDNNYFYITIEPVEEKYDFEKDFIQTKNMLVSEDGYTLVRADKDGIGSISKTMHFQLKDKIEFLDVIRMITSEYVFDVVGWFDEKTPDIKNECIRLMSTFTCSNRTDDTYDLSNAKDGYRVFKAEELNLSFKVPDSYYMTSSEDSRNDFSFYSATVNDNDSCIHAVVYSKSDVGSAYEMALSDRTNNYQLANEKISNFSEIVVQKQYDSITASEYEYTINTKLGGEMYTRDVFFEIGEYVYNVAVGLKLPRDDYKEVANYIINSISAEKIDASEVGILMRNSNKATGTYESEFGNAVIQIPNNYSEYEQGDTIMYTDPESTVSILVQKNLDSSVENLTDVRRLFTESEKSMAKDKMHTILLSTYDLKIGDNKFVGITYTIEDEAIVYVQQFATIHDGTTYLFTVAYPEPCYSEYCRQSVKDIISTMKFK